MNAVYIWSAEKELRNSRRELMQSDVPFGYCQQLQSGAHDTYDKHNERKVHSAPSGSLREVEKCTRVKLKAGTPRLTPGGSSRNIQVCHIHNQSQTIMPQTDAASKDKYIRTPKSDTFPQLHAGAHLKRKPIRARSSRRKPH